MGRKTPVTRWPKDKVRSSGRSAGPYRIANALREEQQSPFPQAVVSELVWNGEVDPGKVFDLTIR